MSKKPDPTTNNKELLITRVIIENFPSRVEIYQKLDTFIANNNFKKDYTGDNKDSIIIFKFKNPDVAFEFVKFLNLEKLKNPIYSKLKTNIAIDTKKDQSLKSPSPQRTAPPGKNKNTKDNASPEKNILNTDSQSHRNKKNNNLVKSTSDTREYTDHDSVIYDYSSILPRGKSLRNSTPYKTDKERKYQEYIKNKEKWLYKKGFDQNFAKLDIEKKTIIPNYVFRSPSKVSVQNYKFREVNKEKWINKKEFAYKNPHDLVI